jgi:hypothetical protein
MIHESHPWRVLLIKDAGIIERWAGKQKWTEYRSVLLEQKIFLAAYSMRKLAEAKKLSSSFSGRNINCRAFRATGFGPLTSLNNHRLEKLFDLQNPVKSSINAPSLLDVIIHSLAFAELMNEKDAVTDFWVTSDRQQEHLWEIDISTFTSLMRDVAADRPSSAAWVFDPDTDQLIEWRGTGEMPPEIQQRFTKIENRYRRAE